MGFFQSVVRGDRQRRCQCHRPGYIDTVTQAVSVSTQLRWLPCWPIWSQKMSTLAIYLAS
jgi:hypothetical protein